MSENHGFFRRCDLFNPQSINNNGILFKTFQMIHCMSVIDGIS